MVIAGEDLERAYEEAIAKRAPADAKRFKESAGWYGDRGIPYRRGYLIHGTPGSGKTSLITAMAGELRLNICILSLSNPSLDVRSSNRLWASMAGASNRLWPQPSHHGRLTQTVAANRTGSSSS